MPKNARHYLKKCEKIVESDLGVKLADPANDPANDLLREKVASDPSAGSVPPKKKHKNNSLPTYFLIKEAWGSFELHAF